MGKLFALGSTLRSGTSLTSLARGVGVATYFLLFFKTFGEM